MRHENHQLPLLVCGWHLNTLHVSEHSSSLSSPRSLLLNQQQVWKRPCRIPCPGAWRKHTDWLDSASLVVTAPDAAQECRSTAAGASLSPLWLWTNPQSLRSAVPGTKMASGSHLQDDLGCSLKDLKLKQWTKVWFTERPQIPTYD